MSYLNRAADLAALALLANEPPRNTRWEHCPEVQAEPSFGALA
jgi:hypothetical protein